MSLKVTENCSIRYTIYYFIVRRLQSVLNAAAPATARPHHRCVDDTALAARPRTCAVQGRGANVQSFARQRATISGTSCRRL